MKLLSQYRGLPKQTYFLSVIMLIVEIAICCVFPFMSLICSRMLGFSTVQTGYIVAFTSLGNIIGPLMGGKLSDHWGRRKTYIRLAVIMIAAMILAGLVCRHRILVLLLFLCNAIASAVVPIISAMVIDISPEGKRNESFSLVYIFSNIGSALGPAIAGMLFYNHFPWTFFTMAICYAVALVLMLFRIKETYAGNAGGDGRISDAQDAGKKASGSNGAAGSAEEGSDRSVLSMMVHSPAVLIFTVCLFMIFVCYTEISYVLPLQFADRIGLEASSRLTSAIWTVNGIVVILFTPVLMLFIKKHKPLFNLVIGCLLYVVGYALYSLKLSPVAAVLIVLVWTSGEIFVNTEGTVYLAEIAPPRHRGEVVALFTFSRGVGKLIGPVLCSHVLMNAGYRELWLIASGISLAVAIVLYVLHRSGSRRND